jgi:hypothetical protein
LHELPSCDANDTAKSADDDEDSDSSDPVSSSVVATDGDSGDDGPEVDTDDDGPEPPPPPPDDRSFIPSGVGSCGGSSSFGVGGPSRTTNKKSEDKGDCCMTTGRFIHPNRHRTKVK